MNAHATSGPMIANWEDRHAGLFGEHTIKLNHRLRETGLFSEEALAEAIEKCPKHHYSINTMGHDKRVKEWREGEIGDCSGKQVIEAIRNGRMWMNVRRLMEYSPEYGRVLNKVFDEFDGLVPGLKSSKRNMTVLISSPKVQVYYHADIQGQSLWQISGVKRVYLYPPTETFLSGKALETILLREAEEEVAYESWFDDYAEVVDLQPGEMIHWPLYAPHRVENHDCLNISVTMEHWSPSIWNSYAVNFGNGVLRRTLGMQSLSRVPGGLHVYPKAAAAFLWKKLKMQSAREYKPMVDFRTDPSAKLGYVDIPAYRKATA